MPQNAIDLLTLENAKLIAQVRELEQNKKIFNTLTGIMADGFLVVGRDNNILDINSAYCEYFGVERQNVIGLPITELIPNTKMVEIMDKNLIEIDAIHEFIKGQTASGERKVAVTRLPVTNQNGEIFASVALVKFSRYTNKLVQSLQEMGDEIEYYRNELNRHSISMYSFESLSSISHSFLEAKRLAMRFAKSDLPILLLGETGVGKEVFAHAIHNASDRRGEPFISVNCASIPSELLESELFGYEDGAFSGGKRGGKRGKFELANNGTLMLDEIGDMPAPLQAKILRVLQDNLVEKVGGERPIQVNVRILAATNHNLAEDIDKKTFREDLYYRLNVLPVTVPPLRERKEDIPGLVSDCLDELNQKYVRSMSISPDTLDYLQRYAWPGNIRELRNVLGRTFMTTDGNRISSKNLPAYVLQAVNQGGSDEPLGKILVQQERDILLSTLLKTQYNCAKTAKALGIHRGTLYSKLEKYGIDIAKMRQSHTDSHTTDSATFAV